MSILGDVFGARGTCSVCAVVGVIGGWNNFLLAHMDASMVFESGFIPVMFAAKFANEFALIACWRNMVIKLNAFKCPIEVVSFKFFF